MLKNMSLNHYIFTFGAVVLVSYLAGKVVSNFESNDQENEVIRKYLLNESPLYGHNKPKLWIHTAFETNARKWKDFHSRRNTDLNQPFIHLTIQTIMNHCGEDFHICLIDDDSFSKLIPDWTTDVKNAPEPTKKKLREIGLMTLLYIYGGVVVPNTFVCFRSLLPMYQSADKLMLCERPNNSAIRGETFIPDTYFMAAPKNHDTTRAMLKKLKDRAMTLSHYSESDAFIRKYPTGETEEFGVIDGRFVGVATRTIKKPITVEELMEEQELDIMPRGKIYGVYIPGEEVLERNKYHWFSVITNTEMLYRTKAIIVKYMKQAFVTETPLRADTNQIFSAI